MKERARVLKRERKKERRKKSKERKKEREVGLMRGRERKTAREI